MDPAMWSHSQDFVPHPRCFTSSIIFEGVYATLTRPSMDRVYTFPVVKAGFYKRFRS